MPILTIKESDNIISAKMGFFLHKHITVTIIFITTIIIIEKNPLNFVIKEL